MLIQSERHIKIGHLIYRWMQIYWPDMVLLFGCSTNRSMPQLQNERNILWLMKVSMVLPHEWLQNSWYDRQTGYEVTTTTNTFCKISCNRQ